MIPNNQIKLPPVLDRGFTKLKKSSIAGMGVFAKKDIPKGTRLYAYEGLVVNRRQIIEDSNNGLSTMQYVMRLNGKQVIDAERNGNDARFINHSCQPNCFVLFVNGLPFIYAQEFIKEDHEITFNYYLASIKKIKLTLTEKKEWFPCKCGSTNCSGTLLTT